MKSAVLGLNVGRTPAIDLSSDKLCRQDWGYVRFDWLSSAYLKDIDLRGADRLSGNQGLLESAPVTVRSSREMTGRPFSPRVTLPP